jgi:hypothetical protein
MSNKWNQADEALKSSKGGSDFLDLEQGANRVRIVSEPEVMRQHWLGGKPTACVGKDVCELCENGDKAKVQFLFYVIDRKDGALKIGRFGSTIVGRLRELQEDADYAFDEVPGYDVKINRKGEGKETEYTLNPSPATDLTAEEAALIVAARPLEEVAVNLGKPAPTSVPSSKDVPDEDLGFKRNS